MFLWAALLNFVLLIVPICFANGIIVCFNIDTRNYFVFSVLKAPSAGETVATVVGAVPPANGGIATTSATVLPVGGGITTAVAVVLPTGRGFATVVVFLFPTGGDSATVAAITPPTYSRCIHSLSSSSRGTASLSLSR